ncbi:MAG: helix-turn-helix transcriptional regulator [bacterium]|nr:helix-turn-helix transcriptional regulator [bacterium]
MLLPHEDVGPALRRLRKARGLPQVEVAAEMGISRTGPSRYEQPGTNLQLSNLLGYLAAIDATLDDLHRELAGDADEPNGPVDERIAIRTGHGGLARSLLERFAGTDAAPELRVLADLIDDQDRRLRRLEALQDAEDRDPPVGGSGGQAGE